MQVGYDVFVNVPALDARDVSALQHVYDADDLDFRLRPGSAAVDRGMVLPTVTDGFTGSAPDLERWRSAAPHRGTGPAADARKRSSVQRSPGGGGGIVLGSRSTRRLEESCGEG